MDTSQIYAALKTNNKTKHCFYGVYPMDMLPKKSNIWEKTKANKQYLIINTHSSFQPGEHWIALCISKNGEANEYFDSYGQKPNEKIEKYLGSYLFITKPLQGFLTTTCGQWCMYYILHKCYGGTLANLTSSLSKLNGPLEKDFFVNKVITKEFPLEEPIVHFDFLIDQISQAREMKKGG